MTTCFVCGDPHRISLGGVVLCGLHYAAVSERISALRAAGKPVDALKIAYSLREPDTMDKYHPSAAEVHTFLRERGITGAQAARMMYLSGSRSVRRYTGGEHPRQMDGAKWFCLHAHQMLDAEAIAQIEQSMADRS